jgi:bifunctional DNA-binding transcriptional regulator/antitoxin component of YhaV-PrlF toxin-antitoxin module
MDTSIFLSVTKRGGINLPPELRRRHHLDEPGAQVKVSEREDGVLELRPLSAIPVEQRWFWTERWQEMERGADDDIAAGRVARFESAEDFLADLDTE